MLYRAVLYCTVLLLLGILSMLTACASSRHKLNRRSSTWPIRGMTIPES